MYFYPNLKNMNKFNNNGKTININYNNFKKKSNKMNKIL